MLLWLQKKVMEKSRFISFEGIDGAGKSTQIELLHQKLLSVGQKCSIYREPGGTFISEKIRKILLDKNNLELSDDCESFLFFASRNQLLLEKIIPDLNEGFFVLCDRFNDSTIAYQGYGKGRDVESLKKVSDFAVKENQPYITFYLDIDVNTSISRREKLVDDRIEQKGAEYLEKVRNGFLQLANEHSNRFFVLNADLDKNEIFSQIWSVLNDKYKL